MIYLRDNRLHNPNFSDRQGSINKYERNIYGHEFPKFFTDPYCTDTPQHGETIYDTNLLGRYTDSRETNEIYTWEQVLDNLQQFHCGVFPVFCYPMISFNDSGLITSAVCQFRNDSEILLLKKYLGGLDSWFEANGTQGQAELLRENHLNLLNWVQQTMQQKLLQVTLQHFLPLMQESGLDIEPGFILQPDENPLYPHRFPQEDWLTAQFAFKNTLNETPTEIFDGGIEYVAGYQITWPEN